MADKNTAVAIYDNHDQAEAAIKEFQLYGFGMKKLSNVGKDYNTEENVVGHYNTSDRVKYWRKQGAFVCGLWGFLFGSAFFFIPGIGPLVSWIVGVLEGVALLGGLSALGRQQRRSAPKGVLRSDRYWRTGGGFARSSVIESAPASSMGGGHPNLRTCSEQNDFEG